MATIKRYNMKRILLSTLWIGIGVSVIVLLVAAIRKDESKPCKSVVINIEGVSNNWFVDKSDIRKAINSIAGEKPEGKPTGSFNLLRTEQELEKNIWVKDAELYFDNNQVLQVNVHEREPLARVFTNSGNSFYIDDELSMLPLSEKYSARLPVFSNFPTDVKVLSKADSALLGDIRSISLAIQQDTFLMAMIEQVDIAGPRYFEMIPKIGNQLIVFGDGSNIAEKFSKLRLFYSQVLPKAGWNTYSQVNLQYKDQLVAKRKDAADVSADSLRTLQVMQMIAENAERMAEDSLNNIQPDNDRNTVNPNMIQQSIQRDEGGGDDPTNPATGSGNTTPVIATPKPTVTKPVTPKPAAKPVTTKPAANKPMKRPITKPPPSRPKVTMPKQNDY
jgi:cell division protein FtsQ